GPASPLRRAELRRLRGWAPAPAPRASPAPRGTALQAAGSLAGRDPALAARIRRPGARPAFQRAIRPLGVPDGGGGIAPRLRSRLTALRPVLVHLPAFQNSG